MKIAKRNLIIGLIILCSMGLLTSYGQHSDEKKLNAGIQTDTSFARLLVEKAQLCANNAQFDSVIFYYKKACDIFYQNEINESFVKYLNHISEQYIQMGNLHDATVYADSALKKSLYNSIIHEIGNGYNIKGAINTYTGFMDSAVFNFEMALSYYLQEDSQDIIPIVIVYINLGVIERSLGDYEKSLDHTYKAIDLLNTSDKNVDEYLSHNYNNLGSIFHLRGRYDEAVIYYNKAMELWLKKYDEAHPIIAGIYNNFGEIYQQKGEYEQALIYFEKALSLFMKSPGNASMNIAACYSNIGIANRSLKNYIESINAMGQSLDIYKSINPSHPRLAVVYNNLSNAYRNIQDYDSALYYLEKSHDILTITSSKHQYDIATCNFSMGFNYSFKKDFAKAIYHFQLAADGFLKTMGRKNHLLSKTYQQMGEVYFKMNNFPAALNYYQQALIANVNDFNDTTLFANPGLTSVFSKVILLATLEDKGRTLYSVYSVDPDSLLWLENAFKTSEIAIHLLDILRSEYKTEGSKVFLNNQNFNVFSMAVKYALDLYEITGEEVYLNKAFEFTEKSKYAVLHSSLMNLEAQHIAGIPDSLLFMERDLKLDINFYTKQIDDEKGKDHTDLKKIDLWQNKKFQRNETYDSLIQTFESNFPEYYNLKYNLSVADIKTIQDNLTEQEVLVEYTLTDTTLVYFVIAKKSFDIFKEKIDSSFYSSIDSYRNLLLLKSSILDIGNSYHTVAFDLYSKLLQPAEHIIDGKKLILVPDGKLATIPFESLVTSAPKDKNDNFKTIPYLINSHPISYGNSATILINSLQKNTIRTDKKLLAFAPSFKDNNQNLIAELTERGSEFVSLEGANNEVNKIHQLISGSLFIDSMATERNFKDFSPDYKILHIATHGILNDYDPMKTRLVFYQDNDSIEDGNLYAYEIYNLQLNADLAVLSACNTGSGKLQQGEGIMNLARGFLYAGIPGIVMSLWSVNDISSAEIMGYFYSYLKSGHSKSEALQKAKLDYIQNADNLTANPYYWAGFVIIGNQHKISFDTFNYSWVLISSGIAICVLIVFLWRKSKKQKMSL